MTTVSLPLTGCFAAVLTPFDSSGWLALEHVPALLDFQRAAGMDGVVVCGTNGEGTSLSVDERKRILDEMVKRRGGLKIYAGTGAASVAEAIDLTKHAEQAGADAALVLPPFFYKNPSQEGLARYFHSVLESVQMPVLLYSIPEFTAVPIENELIDALAGHSNLAGLKDSAGAWPRTEELIARYPHLSVFVGADKLAARGYAAGSAGVISGTANAFPELLSGVRDAVKSGEPGAAEAAQARLDGAIDIMVRYTFIACAKTIIAHRGLPRLGVRAPLVELTSDQEKLLVAELREAGLL